MYKDEIVFPLSFNHVDALCLLADEGLQERYKEYRETMGVRDAFCTILDELDETQRTQLLTALKSYIPQQDEDMPEEEMYILERTSLIPAFLISVVVALLISWILSLTHVIDLIWIILTGIGCFAVVFIILAQKERLPIKKIE